MQELHVLLMRREGTHLVHPGCSPGNGIILGAGVENGDGASVGLDGGAVGCDGRGDQVGEVGADLLA